MEDLGRAALRSRHWKQLARSTGATLILTSETLNRMTLNQFLQLGLQNHSEEVHNIVKRSFREVQILYIIVLFLSFWLERKTSNPTNP